MKLETNYFQKSPHALSEFITMYNMVREKSQKELMTKWQMNDPGGRKREKPND